MLTLAELLTRVGFSISFVSTEHSHTRLLNLIDPQAFPGIKFLSIPDGLPPDHPRAVAAIVDLFFSVSTAGKPILKDLIASTTPAACVISDGIMSFAIDVAAELGVPAITFRAYSATCTWTYFHLQKLIQDGEIPLLEGGEDMDKLISTIPSGKHPQTTRSPQHLQATTRQPYPTILHHSTLKNDECLCPNSQHL